jgi:gamma-glutamyltranspeptidase / glutathione hydrolase
MPLVGYTHRPAAYGTHGLVAAAHPAATLVGLDVLRTGGSVVDAAIAVNAALAVVQPQMCGLGGDLFVLYRDASSGTVWCLNAAGRAGARATPEAVRGLGLDALPLSGPLSVSVPGCVAGWAALAARFGTRSLGDLLKPAIALAEDGFPVSDLLAQTIAERRAEIEDPEWHRIYAPEGRGPRAGEVLRQPDLGRSLARIAGDGPDGFYRGEVASRIVRHVEAGGGFLVPADLAEYVARWQTPIHTTYRDATVYQTPPPTQGLTLLQALALVEGFDVAELTPGSADHLHLLVEATKVADADRDRYLGDPEHAGVPVEALLDKAYLARRRTLVRPRRIAPAVLAGDLTGDTTGFVVATADGSILAGIQSLYWGFGSGVVPPGTGIALHNRGASFSLDSASPSVLAPGKQPFHTLIATLVLQQGLPVAALATMGGHGQPQTHLQVLVNLLDFGMDPQEAVERPRVIQGRFRHNDPVDRLRVEARVPARTVANLRRRGHLVEVVAARAHVMGHAHVLTVRRDGVGPVVAGGADPRGDGLALGY